MKALTIGCSILLGEGGRKLVKFALGVAIGARLGLLVGTIFAAIFALTGPRELMTPLLAAAAMLFVFYVVVHVRIRKILMSQRHEDMEGSEGPRR